MKHILNDISDFEKNQILEQYNNSIIVEIKKFNKLLNSKLGIVRPLLSEESNNPTGDTQQYQFVWSNPTPGGVNSITVSHEKLYKDYEDYENLKGTEQAIDTLIDVVSALLDAIPGYGNLAAVLLDIGHALSYFIRAIYIKEDPKNPYQKLQYTIDGIVTILVATIPYGGNVASVGIKQTIDQLIHKTPDAIIQVLRSYGLTSVRLGTNGIKIHLALLAALRSYFKGSASQFITQINTYSDKVIGKLQAFKELLKQAKYLPFIPDFIKAVDYIISLFEDFKSVAEEFEPTSWWESGGEDENIEPTFYGDKEAIIVVGTYKDKENFFNRANQLIDMGYQTNESNSPDGNTRLGIVVKYNNDTELNSALAKIKKEVQPNAWILK